MKKKICLVLVALLFVTQGISLAFGDEDADDSRPWRPRFRVAIRNGFGVGHVKVPYNYGDDSYFIGSTKINSLTKTRDVDYVPGGEVTVEFPIYKWLAPEISYVFGYLIDFRDGGEDWEYYRWMHGVGAGVKFFLNPNPRIALWADIKGNYYRVLADNHGGIGAGGGLDMKSVFHRFATGPSVNYDHVFIPGEDLRIVTIAWNFRF